MTKRVYWKVGDNEIEVEGDDSFIRKHLKVSFEKLGVAPQPVSKDLPSKIVAAARSSKVLSPSEYYRQTNPRGGTETLIVLAKYLEEFRNKTEFTKKAVKAIARECRLAIIHSQYYTNAIKQRLLRSLGKGAFGLSISGEDAVAAMPSSKRA